ncbi:MAG: alkaline phosphatase family protein [Alphaproteobacteria bacterium]|nr:alkaline phosphatase family protein [Alphaproteobacteria bacterium]
MGSSQGPTRRDTLKSLGLFGAAAATGCGPGGEADPDDTDVAGDTRDTAPVDTDPRTAIDTYVVLMMENRTFDHYFGALALEEGRDDVDGLTTSMTNPDADGAPVAPFRLHESGCLEDPPHGWTSSRRQFNDGACDGFVKEHGKGTASYSREAMGYHNREDLPVYYALADAYALCDRWFASVMGPTWPNRIYAYTATSEGMTTNDFGRVPFTHDTIFDRLTEAGVEWKVYFHNLPFASLLQRVGGLVDNPRLRPIEEFFEDAAAGRLPTVCFVEPSFTTNDDHPPHPPMLGQALVGTVYQALADSPHWDRCLFVVDYDEHGGFFDHVAPPKTEDDHAADGFDQLGFRIPALVVGPYARQATIHTQFDHTSVLAHLGDVFGFEPLTKRDAAANTLWDCLDTDRMARRDPRRPAPIPTLDVSKEQYGNECFYLRHPGQEELEQAADLGLILPCYDRRAEDGEVVDRVMARAEKLGVVRFSGRW